MEVKFLKILFYESFWERCALSADGHSHGSCFNCLLLAPTASPLEMPIAARQGAKRFRNVREQTLARKYTYSM